jgi:tRNA(Ile)-lysidine synthase
MAARDLRYAWFNDLANEFGYEYIATGHNKNDVIETMLLNLSRGTGIRGLMGIRPRHEKIIRPLLFASRLEIMGYAGDNKLQWREDSSNSEIKYHRNKIRHTIIPAFNSINPAFEQNILNTINRLESTGKLLDVFLGKIKQAVWTELPDRVLIDIEKLRAFPATDIVLFELLREYGITRLSLDALIKSFGSTPGKQFFTGTHNITRDRKYLIITKHTGIMETETIVEPDTAFISHPIHLSFNIIDNTDTFRIPGDCCIAALDAGVISYPLKLRLWKNGDRFYPLGLKGSKKISDYLINIKVSLPDKKKIWILESGDKIAWLVSHRIDDRFKITDKTQKILLIEHKECQQYPE